MWVVVIFLHFIWTSTQSVKLNYHSFHFFCSVKPLLGMYRFLLVQDSSFNALQLIYCFMLFENSMSHSVIVTFFLYKSLFKHREGAVGAISFVYIGNEKSSGVAFLLGQILAGRSLVDWIHYYSLLFLFVGGPFVRIPQTYSRYDWTFYWCVIGVKNVKDIYLFYE